MRVKGLEPPRREAPDPKSGVSTNFTTPAVNRVTGANIDKFFEIKIFFEKNLSKGKSNDASLMKESLVFLYICTKHSIDYEYTYFRFGG